MVGTCSQVARTVKFSVALLCNQDLNERYEFYGCGAVQIGIEDLGPALCKPGKQKVTLPKPEMSKKLLMEYGGYLVQEQDNVKRVQLSASYLSGAALAGESGSSMPEGYKAR